MLGHYPNAEKSQLVNYVEDYLECVESLPLDIQRNVSLLREIDTKYQGNVSETFVKGAGSIRCIFTFVYIVCTSPCRPASFRFLTITPNTFFIKHLSVLPKLLCLVFSVFGCVSSSNIILQPVISHFD